MRQMYADTAASNESLANILPHSKVRRGHEVRSAVSSARSGCVKPAGVKTRPCYTTVLKTSHTSKFAPEGGALSSWAPAIATTNHLPCLTVIIFHLPDNYCSAYYPSPVCLVCSVLYCDCERSTIPGVPVCQPHSHSPPGRPGPGLLQLPLHRSTQSPRL